MKIIPVKITNKEASKPMFVDDWDYKILKDLKWRLDVDGYAITTSKRKRFSVLRFIFWRPQDLVSVSMQ